MQEAKYTPGPWHRDGHNLSAIIRLKFPVGHPECKHITGTYETIGRCESDNWDADSRLIAAAPELLADAEANRALFDRLLCVRGLSDELIKAIMMRAADNMEIIAKATWSDAA